MQMCLKRSLSDPIQCQIKAEFLLLFHEITVCSLLWKMALLRTLVSDTEENRMLLTAVTAIRVGRELHNRLTCQDQIDAYKVVCLQPADGAVESTSLLIVKVLESRCSNNNCLCVCVCPSAARLCSKHRTVPPDSPESFAGRHQRRSGEKGPAFRCACESFGNSSTVLNGIIFCIACGWAEDHWGLLEPVIYNINLNSYVFKPLFYTNVLRFISMYLSLICCLCFYSNLVLHFNNRNIKLIRNLFTEAAGSLVSFIKPQLFIRLLTLLSYMVTFLICLPLFFGFIYEK